MLILGLVLSFIFVTAPTYGAPSQASPPSAQLSGRVVEEATGAPISSARVILFPQPRNAPGPVPQTITDQDGRYAFEGVAPGRYRVDVQKSGILPLADPATVPTVTLAAGQVIDDWNVSVQRGGAIAGRILDPFGEPLVDVAVRAVRRSEPNGTPSATIANGAPSVDLHAQGMRFSSVSAFQTNDLGEFRVFGLAPGDYVISASPQQQFGFVNPSATAMMLASTFYPGASDASAAQAITVIAGQTANGVEFRLLTASAFKVSGVVVDEADAPVAGAMVLLRGDPRSGVAIMGPAGQSRSDADGRFVMGNVPSGEYYATATVVFVSGAVGSDGVERGVISGVAGRPGSSPVQVIVNDADVDGMTIVLQRR